MDAYTTENPVFHANVDEDIDWVKVADHGTHSVYEDKEHGGTAYSDGLNTLIKFNRNGEDVFDLRYRPGTFDTWNGNPIACIDIKTPDYYDTKYAVSVRGFNHTSDRLRGDYTQEEADASMQEIFNALNDAMKSIEWMKQVLRDHGVLA